MEAEEKTYEYCKLAFPDVPREYAYLADGMHLRVGDAVIAPFGRDDQERIGRVTEVLRCTADSAPYPPERTKRVLRRADREERREIGRQMPKKRRRLRPVWLAAAAAVLVLALLLAVRDGPAPAAETARPAETSSAAEAAEAARLRAQYSGKPPVEGMPMDCLQYTSLGAPDAAVKCPNFEHLDERHRSYSVYWYKADGSLLAAGVCAKWVSEEYRLYSFHLYDDAPVNNRGQTFDYGGGSSGGLREDYDDPEDLWEDNCDWYEDEDEAWDDWYDD